MHRRITLLACLLIPGLYMCAQDVFWHFGNQAGLKFSASGTVALTDGIMQGGTMSTSTITHPDGTLGLYSDANYTYNHLHDTMLNGEGFGPAVTYSPESMPFYHPFDSLVTIVGTTLPASTGYLYTLFYSVVDLRLDNANGAVIPEKSYVKLKYPIQHFCLTGCLAASGDHYWMLAHTRFSDTFLIYKVMPDTVVLASIQKIGSSISNGGIWGAQLSSDGSMLALHFRSDLNSDSVGLFHFNIQTGELDDYISFQSSSVALGGGYGLEFSPSGKYLYTDRSLALHSLTQHDIQSWDPSAIELSEVILSDTGSTMGNGPPRVAIRRGPDNKLYIARNNAGFLSTVEHPDSQGFSCTVIDTSVDLAGKISLMSLPRYSSTDYTYRIYRKGYCQNSNTRFMVLPMWYDSLSWDFGDPASGSANTSTDSIVAHHYADTGYYVVKAFVTDSNGTDTLSLELSVHDAFFDIDLGDTVSICTGDTLHYDIQRFGATYQWQDGSSGSSHDISSEGLYRVTVTGLCDTVTDSVYVRVDEPFSLSLGSDTTLCESASFILHPGLPGDVQFQWWNGDSLSHEIQVSSGLTTGLEPLIMWLRAENACDTASDTVWVGFIAQPDASLPPDTALCEAIPVHLTHPNETGVSYLWSVGSSDTVIKIDSTGLVWLLASNTCGTDLDSLFVLFHPEIAVDLGEDTTTCPGDSVVLDATWPGSAYLWSTGAQDSLIVVSDEGQYLVTITNGPCSLVEHRQVFHDPGACEEATCKFDIPNVFTPNGDGVNDLWRIANTCDLDYEITVYNRWGQSVFTRSTTGNATGSLAAWDGYVNGGPASEGTYFYHLRYADAGKQKVHKGSFMLLK